MAESKPAVLIVDDDEGTCRTLSLLLQWNGYQPATAGTGDAALALAGERFFNVALVDIRLPDMAGTDLLAQLKKLHPDLEVVLITGYATLDSAIQAVAEGAYHYLAKPLNVDVLLTVIREALEKQRLRMRNRELLREAQQELAERQRVEETLRESEERFRTLAENAQDLIYCYEFTPQRGFTYVSPAATAITGYTPEEHYADPDLGLKIVHPDDRPLLEQYFQGGGVFRQPIVLRWLCKDGTVIWTEQRNVPIYDEAGNLVALEGIARDVTERKQAEEALRASQAEQAAVFESTPLFLALLDEERRVTKINRAGADFAGRPADELLGLPQGEVLRCLHALDDPRGCGFGPYCEQCAVRRTVLDTLHTGRSHLQVEADYPARRDGRIETLRLLVSTAPVTTPAGPRVLVSMEDVTARHRTLAALRAVYDLGQKLVLSLQVEEIAQLVTDAAQTVLRFPRCELWLADEQARSVAPISQTPAEPALALPSLPLDDEQGIISAVVRSGQAICLPDVHQDPRYVRGADYPSRSELCVPLKVRERTIGALNAESDQPDAFGPAERELLEALANVAAVAIENARLYQESRRRAGEMAALREVSLATLSTLEREQVFEIMLDQLGTVIDHDTAAIKVITPDGRDRMIAGRGPVIHDQAMWNGFDVQDNQLMQEMRETGQPVVVHDTRTDERYQKVGDWQAFLSWAGAPLFVRGDFVGYLAVEKASPGFYDENAVHLLGDFARAAAIALENARLYEDVQRELAERRRAEEALRRRLDDLTVLQAIAAAGTEAADEDTLIAHATQIIGETLHLDNFGVILLDEASGLLRPHPSHRLRAGGQAPTLRLGQGIVGRVALTGQPRRVPDVRLDPDYVEGDPQTRSELCVPMKAGERVIGVINSESTALDAYSEDGERLLSTVAGQLATAIENGRLFGETRRLKEFNESIVQSMAEGIFVEDADGVCTFANPAAAELLGYAPQELLGQHWTVLIPPDQHPIVQAANERRMRGQADRYELELVRKDGTCISVLVSGNPRFENGRFVGTMAVFTDISERKRAEAQLTEQLDELRRWHAVTLGREMRVLELKREVNGLLAQIGQPPRYPSAKTENQ